MKPSKNITIAIQCALTAGVVFIFGCDNSVSQEVAFSRQVRQLAADKAKLQTQLEQSQIENKQLQKQVDSLSKLPGDKRTEEIYTLKEVKIGRYTNLYDEDKNGTKETLVVYIQPIDETGDVIKAAGSVDIQLWDLNREDGEAQLKQWHVEPDKLKNLWFSAIMQNSYRLTFDISTVVEQFDRPLTVKMTFVDYLSGTTFTDQKIIRP